MYNPAACLLSLFAHTDTEINARKNSTYFISRGLTKGPCATVAVVLGKVSALNLLHSTTELVCLCDLYFIATMQFLLRRGKNTSDEEENGNDKLLDNSYTQ